MRKIAQFLMSFLCSLFCLLGLNGCQDDGTIDRGFHVYYSGVSDIGPTTPISLYPSYHGATPTNFKIVKVTHNGAAINSGAFLINEQTGMFSISGDETLPVGLYKISISCVASGKTYDYTDAIAINVMNAVPDGIVLVPNELKLPYTDITNPGADTKFPTAQITTEGEHISIKEYRVAGARRNGTTISDAKSCFSVSDEGVVSINADYAGFLPGTYVIDFKLVTFEVDAESKEGIFSNALTVHVTSEPRRIEYSPKFGRLEQNVGWTYSVPQVSGSLDDAKFSLAGVKKNGEPMSDYDLRYVSINETTGQISIAGGHGFFDGDILLFDVTLENPHGSMTARDAFEVDVVEEIQEISGFKYDDVTVVQTQAITNAPKTEEFVGDFVTYELNTQDESLSEILTVDPNTGVVSGKRGHELPIGQYEVTVTATNQKGSKDTTFKLIIEENPDYFTYVHYGHNIEMPEGYKATDFPSQFRIDFDEVKTLDIDVKESDIKEGRIVEYSMSTGASAGVDFFQNKDKCSIDSATGAIKFNFAGASRNIQVIKVTVRVGAADSETSVKRDFFVFVHLSQSFTLKGNTKCRPEFTPFVWRVNPRSGRKLEQDRSVLKVNGVVPSKFAIDYRGDQRYANIAGPESHVAGRPGDGDDRFLKQMWNYYRTMVNPGTTDASRDPVSYFTQTNSYNGKILYIDNKDYFNLVVNPNIWRNEDGWANGFYIGQMIFCEDSVDPTTQNDGVRRFLSVVWFDEKF